MLTGDQLQQVVLRAACRQRRLTDGRVVCIRVVQTAEVDEVVAVAPGYCAQRESQVALHVVVGVDRHKFRPPGDALLHRERDVREPPVVVVWQRFNDRPFFAPLSNHGVHDELDVRSARQFRKVERDLVVLIYAALAARHNEVEIRLGKGGRVVHLPRFAQDVAGASDGGEDVERIAQEIVVLRLRRPAARRNLPLRPHAAPKGAASPPRGVAALADEFHRLRHTRRVERVRHRGADGVALLNRNEHHLGRVGRCEFVGIQQGHRARRLPLAGRCEGVARAALLAAELPFVEVVTQAEVLRHGHVFPRGALLPEAALADEVGRLRRGGGLADVAHVEGVALVPRKRQAQPSQQKVERFVPRPPDKQGGVYEAVHGKDGRGVAGHLRGAERGLHRHPRNRQARVDDGADAQQLPPPQREVVVVQAAQVVAGRQRDNVTVGKILGIGVRRKEARPAGRAVDFQNDLEKGGVGRKELRVVNLPGVVQTEGQDAGHDCVADLARVLAQHDAITDKAVNVDRLPRVAVLVDFQPMRPFRGDDFFV